ncbi:Exosome complex exonuclease RRP6 [Symbiodinium microadriaticum]|uniref:Exosome complex exonuclease RRP6 n=1 Tax=Symbiodinium microadriaticum TaxID=2951 RepID=A0A1Q9C6B8_SYMMI|nr:Exosome complex exonuclease RRP6 [Symbiodinium microadriaticum]CAE7170390.1 RRP6L3 [Symbiodinium microadriaticum]CAE7948555.1 RRP6L3 [Symbiodinium sp. KB8]
MQIDELRHALDGYKAKSCGIKTQVRDLKASDLETCRPLSAENCIEFVDTLDALQRCSHVLSRSSVVGVDVERHWLQSYKGYVCLIQVSTAKAGGKAFLVDSLCFSHEQVKCCLGEVLENPSILKVFHAAANDISWLREEFSIDLRCTLDTQALAHFLGCPIQKLTDQWSAFCHVHASADLKSRLQCSDWRRRPLAPVQVVYAAADSYCLLRIASFLLRVAALRCPSDFENTWVYRNSRSYSKRSSQPALDAASKVRESSVSESAN